MKMINYRELRRRFELDGAAKTVEHLSEALDNGELKADDFSIRDLAEGLVPDGGQWLRELDPRNGNLGTSLLEDTSTFLNITGKVIESKILESYTNEVFAVSKLVSTIPTRLDGEKIPGAASLPDSATIIQPGEPYPIVGFGDDYIETPNTTKRGLIVPVTKEAVFFDRTHLILSRAAEVGETLALNKEKRILDVVLGVTNSYKSNGTSLDTYSDSATPWKNLLEGNSLQDWTNLDAAENLLGSIIDPTTEEPILIEPNVLLVMPAKRHIAHRLLRASEISYNDTTTSAMSAISNPFSKYALVSSRLAYHRLIAAGVDEADAADVWFIGNFKKAFAYMENWPITVTQSAAGSEADFTQDIVVRYKASERGTPAVINPRYVAKCTA